MDYVGILQDLIAIDTSVPPGLNYEKIMDYLEPLFTQVGFKTEKIYIPKEHADGNDGRVNLLAHRRNPGKPRLIFYTHVDVVPAEGWDAFTPRVEDGKIHGRGAADMKGGIAALLCGLEAVAQKQLRYDTSVMVTTDEEVGQADQIRYLGQFLEPVRGAYFFDLDSSFGYVVIASLGAIHMEIRVKGKSVHSALAHLGVNAIEGANALMNALLNLKKEVSRRRSQVDANPETGLTKMEARLNINMIKGGIKVNIIPDECVIAIDRRLIPEESIEEAEKEIMQALTSVKDVSWEVQKIFRIPTVPPLDDPVTSALSETIKTVTGKTGKFGEMGSGDFGPIATVEWKAKHFGSGVIRSSNNIHGKGEFVYRKDIEDLSEIIARFIAA
ncbi:MAG: M20/M25/M40 family metallo-hydrolase [Chloroflexota bacterium]